MVETVFAPSGPLYFFFSEIGIYILTNLTSMCGIYLFKNIYFAFQVMDHAPTLHLQGKHIKFY
jgi:hypothetical protein